MSALLILVLMGAPQLWVLAVAHNSSNVLPRHLKESSVEEKNAVLSTSHLEQAEKSHFLCEKLPPARAISHWESTPPSAMADTTLNYGDAKVAKLVKFH